MKLAREILRGLIGAGLIVDQMRTGMETDYAEKIIAAKLAPYCLRRKHVLDVHHNDGDSVGDCAVS